MMAGRLAKLFGLDPLMLLQDGGDPFVTQVRIAAARVVQRDEEEQQRKQSSGMRRPRRR